MHFDSLYINTHADWAVPLNNNQDCDMSAADSPAPTGTADIVVFDFDGTITTKDTFALFLRYYAGTAKWVLNILILLPIFAAYVLKIIDRNAVKAHVIRRFFKGRSVQELEAKAARFAAEVIPTLIRPAAQAALSEKLAAGESLYICSASITPYLKAWASENGIENVLATELESNGTTFTGEIDGWNIWGEGKVRRILAEFAPHSVNIIEAYGDSRGDRELLHAAQASYYQPFRL